jgi:hypothetical protein
MRGVPVGESCPWLLRARGGSRLCRVGSRWILGKSSRWCGFLLRCYRRRAWGMGCWGEVRFGLLLVRSGIVSSALQQDWIRQTLQDGSLSSFSKFLIPKLETPMFLTLPVAGNFCSSCHVLMKSQSGRCFFKSVGSVEHGQCMRYRST